MARVALRARCSITVMMLSMVSHTPCCTVNSYCSVLALIMNADSFAHLQQGLADELVTDANILGKLLSAPLYHPLRPVLAADAHRQPVCQVGVNDGAHQVVEGGQLRPLLPQQE